MGQKTGLDSRGRTQTPDQIQDQLKMDCGENHFQPDTPTSVSCQLTTAMATPGVTTPFHGNNPMIIATFLEISA